MGHWSKGMACRLGGGKDGILYPVKSSAMGKTQPSDFAGIAANCAKLAGPPVWAAYSPGPVSTCPQDETTLDFMPWGKTRHLHSTPVQYWSSTGLRVFVWGENSQLHAWAMSPTGSLSYVAQGNEVASATVANSPGDAGGLLYALESQRCGGGVVVFHTCWGRECDGDSREVSGVRREHIAAALGFTAVGHPVYVQQVYAPDRLEWSRVSPQLQRRRGRVWADGQLTLLIL